MKQDLDFIVIYPKINVYKNLFNNIDNFLENAKKAKVWQEWYTFGEMLSLQENQIKFNSFPTKEEFISSRFLYKESPEDKLRAELTTEVGEIFYDVTSHYLNMNPDLTFPNWVKSPASINKYFNGSSISENYSMNYHTDYIQPESEMPGFKFAITTTFYINDDYQDGEICFIINDHNISYKPKKGDVIVFPSKHPYYHAVKKSTGADRYMIRSFWQYEYEGSEEWLKNQEKYGKEEWSRIEEERLKKERFNSQLNAEDYHKFFGKDNGLYS
jgi:hypothetical protein